MKKSDIQILNRILRENKKSRPGLMGSIAGKYGSYYYMNTYMILASSEAAEGIEPARDTWDCDKLFDTFNMELIDITIDLEALQAYKKEVRAAKAKDKKPYIIAIHNYNGKKLFLGINPFSLYDLLKFTGTDKIRINAEGLKDGYYKLPFYAEGPDRKGLCLPVNVNPKNAIEPEANQEVDILRAKGLLKGEYRKAVKKEATAEVKEAAPEVKPEAIKPAAEMKEAIETPEVKAPAADDPAYLLAVWYAENIILKQKTA